MKVQLPTILSDCSTLATEAIADRAKQKADPSSDLPAEGAALPEDASQTSDDDDDDDSFDLYFQADMALDMLRDEKAILDAREWLSKAKAGKNNPTRHAEGRQAAGDKSAHANLGS